MRFERRNAFQNALNYIFSRKKILKKIFVPTLPKIFRPVTQNTFIFLFGLTWKQNAQYKRYFLCFFVVFLCVFVFYFIKISKFTLPGVMLKFERNQ